MANFVGLPQPTFNPVAMPDASSGDEALSRAFGELSNLSARVGKSVINTLSTQNFYDNTALANTQKNSAVQSMNENPGNAGNAVKQYKSTMAVASQNADMTASDRSRYNAFVSSQTNSLALKAQEISLGQSRLTEQMQLDSQMPGMLTGISQSLVNDPKGAATQIDALHDRLQQAVLNGSITPSYYQKTIDGVHALMDRHSQLLGLTQNQGATAKDYHASAAIAGGLDTKGGPYNSYAQFKFNTLSSDNNYQDAIAALHTGQINWAAASKMSDNQFQSYLLSAQGVSNAKGMINSGALYPVIQSTAQSLESAPASTLTISQKAELAQYKQYDNALKTNFMGTISQTPAGQDALQAYRDHMAASQNVPSSSEAMQQQQTTAYNSYMRNVVNIAQAQHIPASLIKPVSQVVANKANAGFMLNGNPQDSIDTLNQFSKQNGVWLATSMSSPVEQEVMNTANLLRGTPDEQFGIPLVAANQKGRNYSAITAHSSAIKAALMNNSSIQAAMQHIGQQPNGAQRVNSAMQMIGNYVKYEGLLHADTNLNNMSDYVSNISQYMSSAYPLNKGSNYSINPNETNLTDSESSSVASYLTDQVRESMGGNVSGPMSAMFDVNPINVTNGPDGSLLVKDSNGQLLKSEPVTQNLIAIANAWQQEQDKRFKNSDMLSMLKNDSLSQEQWLQQYLQQKTGI